VSDQYNENTFTDIIKELDKGGFLAMNMLVLQMDSITGVAVVAAACRIIAIIWHF
jgi:hypothetical protein